jgi:hypothetical protein
MQSNNNSTLNQNHNLEILHQEQTPTLFHLLSARCQNSFYRSPICKRREKVVSYLHGGGYNLPILDTHISFFLKCASQTSASLALLEYILTPTGRCPTQIKPAIKALKHFLSLPPSPRTNHYCRGISRWTSSSELVIASSLPV